MATVGHYLRGVLTNADISAVEDIALGDGDSGFVLVGRSSGAIEIWRLFPRLYRVMSVQSGIRGLRRVRFLSSTKTSPLSHVVAIASLDGILRIYRIQAGGLVLVDSVRSGAGPIWDMAVYNFELIACGCEDGTVRVWTWADSLHFASSLKASKRRVVAIAWSPISNFDKKIFAWEGVNPESGATSAAPSFHMPMDHGFPWTLVQTPSNELLVGDSSGAITVWDIFTRTRLQKIKAHESDVLAICLGPSGSELYSTGVDSTVTQFVRESMKKKIQGGAKTVRTETWVRKGKSYGHSHDVKALACFEGPKGETILLSGGVDTLLLVHKPISVSPSEDDIRSHLYYPYADYHHKPQLAFNKEADAKLLLIPHSTHVDIWQLGAAPVPNDVEASELPSHFSLPLSNATQLLLRLEPIQLSLPLTAAAISPLGDMVAISDATQTLFFSLTLERHENDVRVSVRQLHKHRDAQIAGSENVKKSSASSQMESDSEDDDASGAVPNDLSGSKHLYFTRDGDKLIHVDINGIIRFCKVSDQRIIKIFKPAHFDPDSRVPPFSAAKAVALSPTGNWLAVSDYNDSVHIYDLNALKYHGTLPNLAAAVTSLRFHPLGAILVITLVDNTFWLFNVQELSLAPWSQKFESPVRLSHHDCLVGIAFDPSPLRSAELILYGPTYIMHVNAETNKYTLEGSTTPIVHCEYIDANELVVVAQSWHATLSTLPDPYDRKRFKT